MKIKYAIFAVIVTVAIGVMFLTGCKISSTANSEGEQSIYGTNLKLVAKYKPLHLYIYTDTTSTNKFPDYVIFKGHELLFERENESNRVVTTHFEKGLGVLTTERNSDGQFFRRYFDGYDGNSSRVKCFYVDTNDDGLWDHFVIYGTNAESTQVFFRSNLCWIPVIRK